MHVSHIVSELSVDHRRIGIGRVAAPLLDALLQDVCLRLKPEAVKWDAKPFRHRLCRMAFTLPRKDGIQHDGVPSAKRLLRAQQHDVINLHGSGA